MDEINRLRDRVDELEIKLATLATRLEDDGNVSRSRHLVLNTTLTAIGVVVSVVGLYVRTRG